MRVWVNVWGWTTKTTRGVALFAVLANVSGCIDDFDNPKGYGATGSPRSDSSRGDCFEVCERLESCNGSDELTCKRQCVELEGIVESAGCPEEFGDLTECLLELDDACGDQSACDAEPFATCISRYCGDSFERCPL